MYIRKSYLRSTIGQTRLNSIAIINIERSYTNRILQNRWIESLIFMEKEEIVNLFFFQTIQS